MIFREVIMKVRLSLFSLDVSSDCDSLSEVGVSSYSGNVTRKSEWILFLRISKVLVVVDLQSVEELMVESKMIHPREIIGSFCRVREIVSKFQSR